MTPETIETLREGVERLRAEVERASDTSTWPGEGVSPEKLTTATRRARFWQTKNAAAALALLNRHEAMLAEALRPPDWRTPLPAEESSRDLSEEELDAQMERCEAEASRRLRALGISR